MFNVTGDTIEISRGDTGAVKFTATGYTFASEDRALFSIKTPQGTVVKQSAYPLDENGSFTVYFFNHDTDQLPAGNNYTWDVRYVLHPYYDAAGNIIDGNQVITPKLPMSMRIFSVVGEI